MMEWIPSGEWLPLGFALGAKPSSLGDPFHHVTPTGMSYLYNIFFLLLQHDYEPGDSLSFILLCKI